MYYRDYPVRIPNEAHAYSNGRVMVTSGFGNKRLMVGRVCGEGIMYPTEHYFRYFPQEWKEQYPDMPPMTHLPRLGIGLYALTLGIGIKTGLYQALAKTYGAESANGLMDYEMYALLSGFNCKEPFSRMADQMLFSIMPRKDDWYRELFRSGMDEEKNEAFRRFWFNACLQQGIRDVYLCLSDMNRVPEVFCIWVICGSGELKGLPLSYFTVGKDGSTFKEVLESLGKFGLNVLGVLSNSDCCREDVLTKLQEAGMDFVIRLGENTPGFREMTQQYG